MSRSHTITSYLFAEVLLHRLVLFHFAGVPENEGQQQHQGQRKSKWYLTIRVHVDCCNDKKRKQGRKSLTVRPHCSDLLCVLSLHAQLNMPNYTEEKQINEGDCCQTKIVAATVAQRIKRNYKVSINKLCLLLSNTLVFHINFARGDV